MFVITMYFEGPNDDWYCQLGHPREIKILLTYLLQSLGRKFDPPHLQSFKCEMGQEELRLSKVRQHK